MKIELVPAQELSGELIARWGEIVRAVPELASPYFRPEYTQAVAAVRSNVEVGILRNGNRIAGLFPFERVRGGVARPVGNKVSDYQGVIAEPELTWRLPDLLRGCRLQAWEFDHLLASQAQVASHFTRVSNSWQLDLSRGYDAYIAGRKAAGVGALNEMLRKLRKLEREHQVRFAWHSADEAVFDQLLAWKSEQYRNSGLSDLFAYAWIVTLLKNIWRTQTPLFAGVLSALYVDEKVAAIHFGMQSGALLHSWFPAYDVGLAKYSPGSAVLLHLLQHAAAHGVSCLELGKGDEPYKQTFATGGVPLAEGVVETRPLTAALRYGWRQTRDWVQRSPIREPARIPIRWLRRMREWLNLR
jgi:CelD/BcsL family acetyltransferase involved in cellulose biosynthesis